MSLITWLVIAAAAQSSSPTNPFVDVRVGSVELRVPVPSGYCVPRGRKAARFAALAAPDHRNITLLSLTECRETPSNRYLLVKAPIAGLDEEVDRPILKELAVSFQTPRSAESFEHMPDEVGRAKTASTGVPTKLAGAITPRGYDGVCVYLGGAMSTIQRESTQDQVVASCITVVGHRFIALYSYEDTKRTQALKASFPKLRDWALRIRPVRATH